MEIQNKKRPMLFSGGMVQAILEGRKTQTRRIVKYPQAYKINELIGWEIKPHKDQSELYSFWYGTNYTLPAFKCPYGQPGDILWVRETFAVIGTDQVRDPGSYALIDEVMRYVYKGQKQPHIENLYKWKPSIFMPKEAARIWLEITDVRVERLQNISEEDAIAEGIEREGDGFKAYRKIHSGRHKGEAHPWNCVPNRSARTSYEELWESINGEGSWNKNPWVWVIEFKPINK